MLQNLKDFTPESSIRLQEWSLAYDAVAYVNCNERCPLDNMGSARSITKEPEQARTIQL
jgi:hypothetical protein